MTTKRFIFCFSRLQRIFSFNISKPCFNVSCTTKLHKTSVVAKDEVTNTDSSSNKSYGERLKMNTTHQKQFRVFYRLPQIILIRLFSRLKIFQTGITVALVPWTYYLKHQGLVEPSTFVYTISLSAFATFMLFTISQVSQRFIGLGAYDWSTDTVRLSHMTFWGHRKDLFVPLQDLIPPSDVGENTSDVFFKVKRCLMHEKSLRHLAFIL